MDLVIIKYWIWTGVGEGTWMSTQVSRDDANKMLYSGMYACAHILELEDG